MMIRDENEEDIQWWWVSCEKFTCWVKTAGQHGTKIIDAAPIAKRWIGQNFLRFCAYYKVDRKKKFG